MEFKCVFRSNDNYKVQVAKSILESKGIESIIFNDHISTILPHFSIATGGIPLMVKESDYEEAMEIIKDFKSDIKEQEEKDSESKEDDLECPYCDSKNIEIISEPRGCLVGFLFMIFGVPINARRKIHYCKECEAKWK